MLPRADDESFPSNTTRPGRGDELLSARIVLESVVARYNANTALDGISFSIPDGVCALLGPNGAGKTTLLSAVLGLKAFDGSIVVDGNAVVAGKPVRQVGYLPQQFGLASRFRVHETVAYAAWCNGVARSDSAELATRALGDVGLLDKARHRVATLSGGERQRLGVACAISPRPAVLLLDEPTVGLDPAQRARLRQYLGDIASTTAVLIATHLLEDVQFIADKVVVLQRGKVVFDGSKEEMARRASPARPEHESQLESAYRSLMDGEA